MKHKHNIKIDLERILNNQEITLEERRILTSSIQLFSQYGYNHTTIDGIAKKARIKKETLLKYFDSKYDILLKIITPIIDYCIPLSINVFTKKLEYKEGNNLKSLVHFLVNDRILFLKQNYEILSILLNQIIVDDEIREILISRFESNQSSNQTIFEVFQKTGELAADIDSFSLIRIIIGQISVYFLQVFILKNIYVNQKQLEIQIYRALKD